MVLWRTDPDDELERELREAPVRFDLRAGFLREHTRGAWLEALHLVDDRVAGHLLLPPGTSDTLAGVALCADVVCEPRVIHVARGEVLVRFVPSPHRLLPADPSRVALVVVLIVACLSSFGAQRSEPTSSPVASHVADARAVPRARKRAQRSTRARAARVRAARVARVRAVISSVTRTRARMTRAERSTIAKKTGDPEPDPYVTRSTSPSRLRSLLEPPEPRARGPPARPFPLCSRKTSSHITGGNMLVVQIFVTKNGAFQGVEMACGPRIVVGPRDADVPLTGIADAGVVLSLHGEALVASPLAGALVARVDGHELKNDAPVSPTSDVVIGAYSLKLRRVRSQPVASEPSGHLEVTQPALTQPELRTLAEPDVTAPVLALLESRSSESEVDDVDLRFEPWAELPPDPLADVADDDFSWSLVEQLSRTEDANGELVEVIAARGEHVLAHTLLADTQVFVHGERVLVRRAFDGACELIVPARGHGVVRRSGQASEVSAGDKPLRLRLARGDGAAVHVDGTDVLVRFAARPAVMPTLEQLALQRVERKLQAVCASAGMSVCSMLGFSMWLAQYRDQEIDIGLPDDDWGPVIIVDPPVIHPEPEPEPVQPVVEPQEVAKVPQHQQRVVEKASSGKTSGGEAKAQSGAPGDFLKNLPAIKNNNVLGDALKNMRAPIPGRPTGPILADIVSKGRRDPLASIGDSGLRTGVTAKDRDGAGHLERREGKEIGATVQRGQLNKVRAVGEQGLSKEEILRVINDHIGEIQYCYEKGLRGDASLGGRAVVEWTIAADGHVSMARMESSTLDGDAVEGCMLRQLKTWRFPKRATGSSVVYPFAFSSL